MTNPLDKKIESALAMFEQIYIRGLPGIARSRAAFLSFICGVCALEALAGYRYGPKEGPGSRFKKFVGKYMPEYRPHVGKLWKFRCRVVHGFSPAGFSLTHNNAALHFSIDPSTGNPVLNAATFCRAITKAAKAYFAELRADPELQRVMIKRLNDRRYGGPIGVHVISPPQAS